MASASPSVPAASSVTPLTSPAAGPRPGRRRQRSVRVTVAVALLGVATALVLVALPTQSPVWLSVASVVALASGWAAARIVYTELAQSRREAAADRAAQAIAYRSMFSERATEHAEFTTAMTDRIVRRDAEIAELETTVVAAEKRAIEAEARVQREARRANDAQDKVAELSERVQELEIRKAEEDDELATWHSDLDVPLPVTGDGLNLDIDAVVDLIAWEERVTVGARAPESEAKKHA
jgi:hypothetical protein